MKKKKIMVMMNKNQGSNGVWGCIPVVFHSHDAENLEAAQKLHDDAG